jgi:hypothetical protein
MEPAAGTAVLTATPSSPVRAHRATIEKVMIDGSVRGQIDR